METDQLSFEILDIDYEVPTILNHYIVELERTYMYYRISTSESAYVYYLLSLRGTREPTVEELRTPEIRATNGNQTDVIEITGKNSSEQTEITSTYIYYDVYLKFEGLEEQTEYVLYYVVEDLSQNNGEVYTVDFQTLNKH